MTRDCTCTDWRENIAAVNGPLILQQIRSGLYQWRGKPFEFCPWCGKPLPMTPDSGKLANGAEVKP